MSYADAVRLLGGSGNRVVTALDRLTGGLLLAAAAAGSGFALSLFEARDELVRLSGELVAGLDARMRGLDRFQRSERLAAAHAVIVLTAYFDALAGARLPFESRELELTSSEQVSLAVGEETSSGRLRALAAGLLRAEIPLPVPHQPFEDTLVELRGFYSQLSEHLLSFVSGLAVYEQLDEANREDFAGTLRGAVPDGAVAGYEELFHRLALEFPEVALWANMVDHQATRVLLRRLNRGLEDLERALAGIAAGRGPDERRVALWRAYRAVLDRPALPPVGLPEGLHAPPLAMAYVDPEFRVAAAGRAERFGEESWWADKPVHDGIASFLAGHLTSPQAVMAPLLVLGQPGSGKSVLTQVLAARLPPSDFLVVRVVLRDVAADTDLQSQVEDAIRLATGENLAWSDLARSAGDALPVVLLDGFDELLQATGVSQTDYLRKIAGFQTREADQGRPAAVLVTSRTAVADRALPAAGMIVIRLEPFRETQIARWLQVWNDANAAGFGHRGLQPLPLDTVLAHPELAAQPLLLLMLALYDADDNRLQREDASLSTADLYERLLTGFAEREVDRSGASLAAGDLRRAADDELLRLSVAALAMFNRGRQWITEAELDEDLLALKLARQPGSTGLRAPLSAAQVTLGRFFFVHESQATREGTRLRTFEFLHATFGEYLIARLLVREFSDLAEAAAFPRRSRPAPPDDAFVHALTSFMPLSMRGTVISFIAEQLQALPAARRDQLGTLLADLFREALFPRFGGPYGDYTPLHLPATARHAASSANLLMLAVLAHGQVRGSDLFPGARDPVEDWSKLALLWRSQLPPEGWSGLMDAIIVDRAWENDEREITLWPRCASGRDHWVYDPYWTRNLGPGHEHRPQRRGNYSNWVLLDYAALREQARFIADPGDDAFAHALEPLAGLGTAIIAFHGYWHDRAMSAANALITLWLASSQDTSPDDLAAAYDACLLIAISGFAPSDTETRRRFRGIFLRQLAADKARLPQAWLTTAVREIREAAEPGAEGPEEGAALQEMAMEILPDLIASDARNSQEP